MKKVLTLFALTCMYLTGNSQTAATYALSTVFGTYASVTGGTTIAALASDDGTQTNISIGFNFVYCGTTYTQLSASANGYVSLANSSAAYTGGTSPQTFQNSTAVLPSIGSGVGVLMPFWDDLQGTTGATSSACTGVTARYRTTGTAPNRIFTIEWFNFGFYRNFGSTTPAGCGSFEVKLYETTNRIEFCYSSSTFTGSTATIGIANSATDFKTLTSNIPFPGFSTSAFNSDRTAPADGVIYRWCPQNITTTASNSGPFCAQSAASLTGGATGTGLSFSWSGPSSFTSTVQNPTIASANVAASGVYTFTATIGTCSANDTTLLTINPRPSRILGSDSVCARQTIVQTNGTTGGTWASSNTSIATVVGSGAASSTVGGVAAGNAVITYTLPTGCDTVKTIRVLALPVINPITGASSVCNGSSTTLSNSTPGGVWTSSNTSIAFIGTTGIVNSVSAGTVTITYTVTNASGCSDFVTFPFTVEVFPAAGPITGGPSTICEGTTASFANSVSGGTWSSSNVLAATIDASGVAGGVAGGTSIISYSIVNSCGRSDSTVSITVNPLPHLGPVTGNTIICIGTTTTLVDTPAGGTWISGDNSIATVSASGVVTGVSVGNVDISYTATNGCGTDVATANVTVNPVLSAGAISGPTSTCVGGSITLLNGIAGGTWSSANTAIATVNPTTGEVTGVSLGSTNITYTISNTCGTLSTSAPITISTTPDAGAISGTLLTCVGFTSALTETVTGGTWSSSNSGIASVDPSTGVVTGISAGVVDITYSITNFCGTNFTIASFTVEAVPDAGIIFGPTSVCPGSLLTLSETTTGGVWSSSNTAIATVNATTGVVGGASAGTATISYSITYSCGVSVATYTVTVLPLPSSSSISGASGVCPGGITTLTSTVSGGTWSSANSSIASIDPASGTVTGIAIGSTTITYVVSNSCGSATNTFAFSVIALPDPGSITGTTSICAGTTTTLSNHISGGTWTSTNPSVATVSSSGVVTGVSAGSTTISYSLSNSCGTAAATAGVNILTFPSAGVITGTLFVCQGNTNTLVDTVGGGTWMSSDTSIARIDASGVVTGVNPGVVNIYYLVTNSCGSSNVTVSFQVFATPSAGAISGPSGVCIGSSITLVDTVTGGTWSSSDTTVATIDGTGIVTGINTGTATISYTISTTCGLISATYPITVNPIPSAGTVTGSSPICQGASASFTATISGGTWSSRNPSIATVDASSGMVTGLSAGLSVISYTVISGAGCVNTTSTAIIVNAAPVLDPISGSSTLCIGGTTSLTNSTAGGVWTSSNTTVATIDTAGTLTGISAGFTTISYTVTNGSGCSSTVTMVDTISPLLVVVPITGPSRVCVGSSITLADSVLGGTWSSSNTAIANVGAATGIVSGVSGGSATITYSTGTTAGCISFATRVITVDTLPDVASISGPADVCAGNTITLTNATIGGAWSSTNTTVATVSSAGVVSAIAAGTDTIVYTVTNAFGCVNSASTVINVHPLPVVDEISGSHRLCVGSSTTLTDSTAGGWWSSSNTSVAVIDSFTGIITGISAGTTTISYTVTNSFGCSTTVTFADTVNNNPVVSAIVGPADVCLGSSIALTDSTTGGTWSSSNTTIATVSTSGNVSGLTAGSATISYTVTNAAGCSTSATTTINVRPIPTVDAIIGSTSLCAGSTSTFVDSTVGGVWSSTNPLIATISATGVATAVSAGINTIYYTVTSSYGCIGSAMAVITINPLPVVAAITGDTGTCIGITTTLSSATVGGMWSSSNTSVAVVDSFGNVSGISAGSATITYSVTSLAGCTSNVTRRHTIQPNPAVAAISGPSVICMGSTVVYSNATVGGIWSSNDTTIARINSATGVLTSVNDGATTIRYTVTSSFGCSSTATLAITVDTTTLTGTLSPSGSSFTLCNGIPVAMSVTSASAGLGYQWYKNSVAITGATSSTYSASTAGLYSVVISTATCSGLLSGVNVINPPNATISYASATVLYTGTYSSYQWLRNGVIIPGATSSVYAVSTTGVYAVVVTDANGCADTSNSVTVTVTGIENMNGTTDIKLYPNPATSIINIEASIPVNVSVCSMDGKVLLTGNNANAIDVNNLAAGLYLVMIYDEHNTLLRTEKFTKQ